jgi:lysylphosphatidylglycerol synthetase-like protein (DUF2156 family)
MGVAALVLGIFSIILCVIPSFAMTQGLGALTAVVALVLGVVARRRASETDQASGLATAGMVLGIIAFVLNLIVFASCLMCQARYGDQLRMGFRKGLEKAREVRRRQDFPTSLPAVPPASSRPATGEGLSPESP